MPSIVCTLRFKNIKYKLCLYSKNNQLIIQKVYKLPFSCLAINHKPEQTVINNNNKAGYFIHHTAVQF